MQYIKPNYFDCFRCSADKCPDTCCAGWKIVIDKDAMKRYKKDKSTFRERLQKGIDWNEGCFQQYHGRCSMLNADNLCDMVIEKGEEWLCETCSRYPRHVEEFDGLREWSLSLSCPVAADIMLNNQNPVQFVVEEDDEDDPLEEEFEDFDFFFFTQLENAREVLFSIVQNRSLPMKYRMAMVLDMAKEMQLCRDEERLFDMDDVIDGYTDISEPEMAEQQDIWKRYEQLVQGFETLKNLERLREDWTEVLVAAEKTLYMGGMEAYQTIYEAFCREFYDGGEKQRQWEIFQEQILIFFLYTYFCGAVYDDCIYSKAALGVFSVVFIQELVMCSWYLADKYIDKQECIRLAYRYAREVEHSDENLISLEEWLLEKM